MTARRPTRNAGLRSKYTVGNTIELVTTQVVVELVVSEAFIGSLLISGSVIVTVGWNCISGLNSTSRLVTTTLEHVSQLT